MEQTFTYIVEFDNGEFTRVIGKSKDYRECLDIIANFLEDKKYVSRYWRHWVDRSGKKMHIDVGCHFQFFYISRDDGGDMAFAL